MADELEIPGDRSAVADWTFRGARAARDGFLGGGFFPRRRLRPRLGLGGPLRDLLACGFHSTLHALTSQEALARLSAAGEVAARSQAVGPREPGAPPAAQPLVTGTIASVTPLAGSGRGELAALLWVKFVGMRCGATACLCGSVKSS